MAFHEWCDGRNDSYHGRPDVDGYERNGANVTALLGDYVTRLGRLQFLPIPSITGL